MQIHSWLGKFKMKNTTILSYQKVNTVFAILVDRILGKNHSVPSKFVPWGPGKFMKMVPSFLDPTCLAALTIKTSRDQSCYLPPLRW